MSEHTPGPLQIVEAKTLDNSGQWHVYLAAPDGRKIAALWGNQDEKEGNARLFAAAPDMLDALRIIADWDKQPLTHEHPGALIDVIRSICDRARAEITKATQVSPTSALSSER